MSKAVASDDPKPVLSEEQAARLCLVRHRIDERDVCSHDQVRAVERAVLEALPDAATEAQANADLCARLMALEGDNEALRARVAELELENEKWQDGHLARTVERDAARRELEEAREDTARLDWLGAPDDVGGRWARVWRTWNGEEPLRAALDRAREGE